MDAKTTEYPHIVKDLWGLVVPVDSLHEDPANARLHDDRNMETIRASFAKFGQRQPIVVQKGGMVVRAGNARLRAARDLGWSHVAAVVIDEGDLSASAYAIADNRTSDLSEFDPETLATLLDGVRMEDAELLASTGFSDQELDDLLESIAPKTDVFDDPVPDLPDTAISKRGQIWELGRHRVLCGDSTAAPDVERLLDGAKPFLMVTDPPYGVDYAALIESRGNQKKGGWEGIEGDALGAEDLEAVLTSALACPSAKVAFVWHPAGAMRAAFSRALEANGWRISQEIVWVKNALVFGRADYQWRHEPCMYAKRDGAGRQEDRTQTTVWEIDKQANASHPTEKPVECMARPIRNHGDRGDHVYDPFLGSGTTMIAAEQLGRTCYGIEIEPRYVDVILQRWSSLTGGTPELIGDPDA